VHPPAGLLLVLLAAVLLLPAPLRAAFEGEGWSARARGLGLRPAAAPASLAGRAVNPAAGAWLQGPALAADFARPWGMAELDRIRVEGAWGRGAFAASLALSTFGSDLYRETSAGLALSGRLGGRVAAGIALRQGRVELEGYGDDAVLSGDLGLLGRLGSFSAGASLRNLLAGSWEHFGGGRPPLQGVLALRWVLAGRGALHLGWELEEQRAAGFALGLEVPVGSNLILRGGYDGAAGQLHLGFRVSLGRVAADGGLAHHPWLGWTRGMGLRLGGLEPTP
jgi:hypothetical protein